MEELRAELSSAFIAGELGIPADIPQHASYIENWLGPLKKDRGKSSALLPMPKKIADMVLEFHPDFALNLCATRECPSPQPASPMTIIANQTVLTKSYG
jgi:antirestriction protein ArdC